jgi:hypothetical protein
VDPGPRFKLTNCLGGSCRHVDVKNPQKGYHLIFFFYDSTIRVPKLSMTKNTTG